MITVPSSPTLTSRIFPPSLRTLRHPERILERQWVEIRRGTWKVLLTGFFEPFFYLVSMQVGLNSLIGTLEVDGQVVSYVQFVAPALFAASAMNGAVFESTLNFFARLRYSKAYDAVLATPMSTADVAVGEMLNATARGLLYSIAFLVTMAAMGTVGSWWALALPLVSVVISLSISGVGMAATTAMRGWSDAEYVNAIVLPVFLFSATFYPVSAYGSWAWVANISPLYHAVVVCRSLNLGVIGWPIVGHLAVLVVIGAVGFMITSRRINTLLLS